MANYSFNQSKEYRELPTYYLTQQNIDHSPGQCGPIALYNYLYQRRVPISSIYLIEQCKAHPDYGTKVSSFDKMVALLNKMFINISLRRYSPEECTLQIIKQQLEAYESIIILYHWTDGVNSGNHYALIDEIYNDYGQYKFRIINHSFDTPVKLVSAREIKSMLLPHTDKHFTTPVIWGYTEAKYIKYRN
jgi:hypothetical protein